MNEAKKNSQKKPFPTLTTVIFLQRDSSKSSMAVSFLLPLNSNPTPIQLKTLFFFFFLFHPFLHFSLWFLLFASLHRSIMGCFLACFGDSKRRKPRKSAVEIPPSHHVIPFHFLLFSFLSLWGFVFWFLNDRWFYCSLIECFCRFLKLLKVFVRWSKRRRKWLMCRWLI